MTKENKQKFPGTNMKREIAGFALPLAGSGLFQQMYSLVNTAVLSRELSVTAVSVLGACGAFIAMQSYLANGLTTGFGIYLSRCYGKGDAELYRKCFSAAVYLNGILAVISVILAWNAAAVLSVVRVPPELLHDCKIYLSVLLLGTGFLGFKNLMVSVSQGSGEALFSGGIIIFGLLIQTGFLLLLISGLGLGISASPLSVLLHHLLLGILLTFYMKRKYRDLIRLESPFRISGQIWKEMLASGCAKSGMMVLVGIGNFFMQYAKNAFSPEILAGSSMADTLSNLFLVPSSALAQTAWVSVGQNMGRKKFKNIHLYNRRILAFHFGWTFLAILAGVLWGTEMLRLLAGADVGKSVISAGYIWLIICTPGFFGLGTAMICRNSLQAMGSYQHLIYLGIIEMSVTIFFAVLVVPKFGYQAYCISILTKWTILGIAAEYWYRKKMKKMMPKR